MAKRDKRPTERLHQSVARELGTAILSGAYGPNGSIEGEIEQSAALGVSRTAYREAIRILVAKGLLESRPKAGTHVTDRSRWNLLDPDVLAWMFTSAPDERFVHDLFELRGVLEPAAAELAARRHTAGHIERMGECLAVMRDSGLATDEGQEADRQFHRILLEATGNDAFVSLGSSIGAAVRWTTHFKQSLQTVVGQFEIPSDFFAAGIIKREQPHFLEKVRGVFSPPIGGLGSTLS